MGAQQMAIGISFSADVIKRNRQLILVLRECVASYTATTLVGNEQHDTQLDALIRLRIEMRPLNGPTTVIRTDPAPGYRSLVDNELLHRHIMTLANGRVKNRNKNPVAEKVVQEQPVWTHASKILACQPERYKE